MNKNAWIILAAVVVVLGGGYLYMQSQRGMAVTTNIPASTDMGTYEYECDEHVGINLTPTSDMSSIKIGPSNSQAAYPPVETLMKKEATSGVRYQGSTVILTAHGETVTLGEGDSAINCSPVKDPNNAPFNFGD